MVSTSSLQVAPSQSGDGITPGLQMNGEFPSMSSWSSVYIPKFNAANPLFGLKAGIGKHSSSRADSRSRPGDSPSVSSYPAWLGMSTRGRVSAPQASRFIRHKTSGMDRFPHPSPQMLSPMPSYPLNLQVSVSYDRQCNYSVLPDLISSVALDSSA